MTDPRTLAPLTASSKLLSIYWWLLALAPPLNLVLALEPLVTGRAPEEALGGFVTVPLLIATLLLAPAVMVRALTSPELSRKQKLLCFALCIGALPMFLLVQEIWSVLGTRNGLDSMPLKLSLAAVALVWVGLAWTAKSGIRGLRSITR